MNMCRMKELIPILVQYIQSRQKPGGRVILVAHNGKIFDVPFLKEEFRRHSCELPSNWVFLDTVPLARKLLKSGQSSLFLELSGFVIFG